MNTPQLPPVTTRVSRAATALALARGLGLASTPVSVQAASAPVGTQADGKISYYGKKFAGRKTASGEKFDPEAMTMAHPKWPFGTRVRVTNLQNKKSVVLRVNDRGPSIPDRVADVSSGAARKLGFIKAGLVDARLEVVAAAKPAKAKAGDTAAKAPATNKGTTKP
ncbi:MAG: septal ring lytic transglycosylase RlpA family protein [Burkholderiaceae bacterium]